MIHYHTTFSTSFGPFSAAVSEDGALVATAFGDLAALRRRFHSATLARDDRRLAPVRKQIEAYFARKLTTFMLPLAAVGTDFQRRVWTALTAIPFGATCTYGDLARELHTAPRAIGRANATNPICLVVPCHRVLGADGALTGFAFGEAIKQQLLAHELAVAAPRTRVA